MNLENLVYEVESKPFNKKDIFIPTSKSYANRLLILACLSKERITLRNLPHSTDVMTMIECLKEVGIQFKGDVNELIVLNSFPGCERSLTDEEIHLRTGDGGTTNRFLMGFLSLGTKKYFLHPTERISERPIDGFIEELRSMGVKINLENEAWLSLQGPLSPKTNEIVIDCSHSTQFATAMQLALSTSDIEIIPKNLHRSARYFKITKDLVKSFKNHDKDFDTPLDFSSFGYPLALAAVFGKLELTHYAGIDELQADSEIVNILKAMNAKVNIKGSHFLIEKSQLKSVDIDCSDFPDLVPTLAFLCSYAKGTSKLKNIDVLRHKESDRIVETLKILHAFNIKAVYHEKKDYLEIDGDVGEMPSLKEKINLKTAKDHRMIMVAYLFMRVNSGGTLNDILHINKSYPKFLEVMG